MLKCEKWQLLRSHTLSFKHRSRYLLQCWIRKRKRWGFYRRTIPGPCRKSYNINLLLKHIPIRHETPPHRLQTRFICDLQTITTDERKTLYLVHVLHSVAGNVLKNIFTEIMTLELAVRPKDCLFLVIVPNYTYQSVISTSIFSKHLFWAQLYCIPSCSPFHSTSIISGSFNWTKSPSSYFHSFSYFYSLFSVCSYSAIFPLY